MRLPFIVAAILIAGGLALGLIVPVEAAPNLGNETSVSDEEVSDDRSVSISEDLAYSDVSYADGVMMVTFNVKGERPVRVFIADSGGVFDGGPVSVRSVRLLPGETTVRLPVTEISHSGSTIVAMSVTYDSDQVYAIVHRTGSTGLIGGPWSASDAQASALGAAAGVTTMVLYVVLRALFGRDSSPERLA